MTLLAASTALRVWYGLGAIQYWDEEFSLANTRQVLATATLEPVTGYYPLLTYLPVAAFAAAAEWAHGALDLAGEPPRLLAVARIVQTAYGTLALLALFALGRRVFGETATLLAVAAAAFAEFDIWAWGYFKPDGLLALTTLLALLAALHACRRPAVATFAAAGVGIALAASSKFPGVVAAASLFAGAASLPLPRRRRIALLAIGGAAAIAGFLLLNPYWQTNLEYLSIVESLYERKNQGAGRMEGLRAFLFDFLPDLAGWPVALLFAAGCLWLGARLLRGGKRGKPTAGIWIVLIYPVAFTTAYLATTPRFQGNNFSPVAPLVLLIAAATATAGWEALRRRWPAPAGEVAGWLLALGLTSSWAAGGFSHVYRVLVPESDDVARQVLEGRFTASDFEAPRLVFAERTSHALPFWQLRRESLGTGWAVVEVNDLDSLPREERELADALVSVARGSLRELPAADGPGVATLATREGADSRTAILPVPFRVRGPALEVRAKGWELAETPRKLQRLYGSEDEGARLLLPDDLAEGSLISFAVRVAFGDLDRVGTPSLDLGARVLPLHWSGRDGQAHRFVSPRLLVPRGLRAIGLRAPGGPVRDAEVELCTWRRPPSSG